MLVVRVGLAPREAPVKFLRCLTISTVLIIATNGFAQGEQRGRVTDVDQSSGLVTIQVAPGGTVGSGTGANLAAFAVEDTLMLDALTQGDEVTFSSQELHGANTITKIQKR
jgi:Cu/Ag efflux protein CusF